MTKTKKPKVMPRRPPPATSAGLVAVTGEVPPSVARTSFRVRQRGHQAGQAVQRVTVWMPPALYRRLRIEAIDQGSDVSVLVVRAVEAAFAEPVRAKR